MSRAPTETPPFYDPAKRWSEFQNKHPKNPSADNDTAFIRDKTRQMLAGLRGYIEANEVTEEMTGLRQYMRAAAVRKDANLFLALLDRFQELADQGPYAGVVDFSTIDPEELDWDTLLEQITFDGDEPPDPSVLDNADE